MKWPSVEIETSEGRLSGIAPVIISASRSTDVPAFHADWFMNRLRAGYLAWVNPFNRRKTYVSFQNAGAVVFWTKNPEPLFRHFNELDMTDLAYYFQYTLNDYEHEGLEPRLPRLEKRIETFQNLSRKVGKSRVIWRFDPIVLGCGVDAQLVVDKFRRLGEQLQGYTEKVVISFVDIADYRKVQNTIKRVGLDLRAPSIDEEVYLAKELKKMADEWGMEIATCCEKRDLTRYGVKKNKCVDDELLFKICTPRNTNLKRYLEGYFGQLSFLSSSSDGGVPKDSGQRAECGCVVSKDIGMYDTCAHMCVYCYANTSEKVVCKNIALRDPEAETIVPV